MKTLKETISTLAFPVLGLIITALVFAACKKPNVEMPPTPPAAGVMAFNLAPDQPAAAFELSGNRLGSVLTYSGFTGVYLPVYTGGREVRTLDVLSGSTLAISNNTFVDSAYYSAFIMGANGNYRNVVIQDDVEPLTPVAGKAWVRFVNAIPDSSTTHSITIGTNAQTATYTTVSDFVQVDAGTVNAAITNGSSINASRTLNLQENKIYTVLFIGLPSPVHPEKAVEIRFIQNGIASNS